MNSSQGAESLIRASFVNNIKNAEPQKVLQNFVARARTNLLKRKEGNMSCTQPVPPHIERKIAQMKIRSRNYQESVQFIEGTNIMEATVSSSTDPTMKLRVVLSNE